LQAALALLPPLPAMTKSMKILIINIFLFGGLYGYGQQQQNDSLRNPYSQYYLTDLDLRKVGQLIVSDSIQPLDNNITFSILDSVTTGDTETRNYFIPAFKAILIKSDGALSEVLGIYCIASINNNRNELLQWLSSGKLGTTQESIVQYIVYELFMSETPKEDKIVRIYTIIPPNLTRSRLPLDRTTYFQKTFC